MDREGQLRQVAVANLLPYRGERGAERPTRVWDLPVELMSDDAGEAAAAGVVELGGAPHEEWDSVAMEGPSRGWTS
jgi:hypothetical protein